MRPTRVAALLREVEHTVTRHYPAMFTWVWATLAISAVCCLRDTRQPVALIGIGLPGVGKTGALSFLTPTGEYDDLAQFFYRSDGFTPAAFVGHQASRTAAQLDDIDLLPRIKERTLLTPELAQVFRSPRAGPTAGPIPGVMRNSQLRTAYGAGGRDRPARVDAPRAGRSPVARREASRSAPVPAAAAATAIVAVARLVDLDRTALDVLAIELLDRPLSLGVRAHLDKAEAARLAAELVGHDGDRFAGARLPEGGLEVLVGDVEREVSYVQFLSHDV